MADITALPTPVNGRILIELIEETAGTIILSDNAKAKPQKGRVIAIADSPDYGENGHVWHCPCQVGDTIYYSNWGSVQFNEGGKEYVTCRFRDVAAIL